MSQPFSRRRALQGVGLIGAAAFLAACSGAGGSRLQGPGAAPGHNDINALPRDRVRTGGDLRWPLDQLPDNYNYNQFDGPSGYALWVISGLMPAMFVGTADGDLTLNRDYLTSAMITSPAPQTITYTINPRATWSDGKPIIWRDFEAQWKALNGTDPAYLIASKTGYENVASVTRGVDDKQVIVTFGKTFAEWKALFSPLYPASANADPGTFNTGWQSKVPVTAGPFAMDSIDLGAKTVTVKRDPRWWGTPAKLDRIIYRVYERAALADALANNEIDFYMIGSSVDLFRRAQTIPGAKIREATERMYTHITFNGAPSSALADVRLRQAIAKGIDRHGIAARTVGQIVPQVELMDNHIYAFGSKEYHDNSAVLPFDQAAAKQELDALGWVQQGTVRSKNGKPLSLRFVIDAQNPISEAISKTVLAQLGQIGVKVDIEVVPSTDFFKNFVNTGNFDLVGFVWVAVATPFSASQSVYAKPEGKNVQQNFGRIYSPEIDALFAQGIGELDDAKRAALGNQIDQLIWREVHHLPIYPGTGAYAVRSTLANFGAPGFADIDYINSGFVK